MDFHVVDGNGHGEVDHVLNAERVHETRHVYSIRTVISLRRTSGRLADLRMRSNFSLFL